MRQAYSILWLPLARYLPFLVSSLPLSLPLSLDHVLPLYLENKVMIGRCEGRVERLVALSNSEDYD